MAQEYFEITFRLVAALLVGIGVWGALAQQTFEVIPLKHATLDQVLPALRPLVSGRLIVVFGAGGDRDRGKRPLMGAVAAAGADIAIVTSDNPRTEQPEAIIDDIVSGMKGARYERITDRREAIRYALEIAAPDDVILLAGKGHETYQVLGHEKVSFDEQEVVREHLATLNGSAA